MPKFSRASENRLATVHEDLQLIFEQVILNFDCTIICGVRGREAQEKAFAKGHSKAHFGESPHNFGFAADAGPYDVVSRNIDWQDRERITYFAGHVIQTANILYALGVTKHLLVWGGDWNSDTEVSDNGFDDLVHFEIADWRAIVASEKKT